MPCLLISAPESFHSMTALYVIDPNIAVKVFLLILGNRSISNFRIITALLPAWLALGIFFFFLVLVQKFQASGSLSVARSSRLGRV